MERKAQVWLGAVALSVASLVGYLSLRPAPTDAPPAAEARRGPGDVRDAPRFDDVGPRIVSNQTRYPVMIYGEHLPEGASLVLSSSVAKRVSIPTKVIDDRHLAAVIPQGIAAGGKTSAVTFQAGLIGPDGHEIRGLAPLTVVDDADLAEPLAIELSGDRRSIFVASWTTDQVWVFDRESPESPPRAIETGDGPRALGLWLDPAHAEWLVVGHQFGREVVLLPAAEPSMERARHIALGADAGELVIDQGRGRAYVSSREKDAVLVVDLTKGAVERELPAGVNPRALALLSGGGAILACNLGSEDFSLIPLQPGRGGSARRITAHPGTPILGGPTEKYSRYIIGAKAGRAAVHDPRRRAIFIATIGPNIGPNPDRMEVSMNGGVSVLDPAAGRYVRHVATGGVPEALALDEGRGFLYAADSSTGRVFVLDASRLTKSDRAARTAVLGSLEIEPPDGTPLIRPAADFGANKRATTALHSGPKALRLDVRGQRLFVLNRFTRSVSELDVSRAKEGRLTALRTFRGPADPAGQRNRRLGEVVYFTDLGRTGMTCDTCHLDGHDGGILFTKTTPMRVYRSPTLRAIKETPPYFTPSRLPSIQATCRQVLARNRYQNAPPTHKECDALTEYVAAIAPLPNPFVAPDGTLPRALSLPDGHTGDAAAGLRLFEGKAGCAIGSCHPPPQFSGDQSLATRGALHHVGTPLFLSIRPELQDSADYGHQPPSLTGVWDTFPLLDSGAAGLSVEADGTVAVMHPFALRRVLELSGGAPPHGNARALSAKETDDLLAYLFTL